jgi:hypothetical protein
MTKEKELDMYKNEDRNIVLNLPCGFCGEKKLRFSSSSGYGSHFTDSEFVCASCWTPYPVTLFMGQTISECIEKMKNYAQKQLIYLQKEQEQHENELGRIKSKIHLFKDTFNPSARDI